MNALSSALWIYVLTIVFGLLIAVVIRVMEMLIDKSGFARGEEEIDVSIPSANTAREEEALAVAIIVAHAQHR